MEAPWTRDGRVRADVVAVAPDVSGLVTEVLVHDNQEVKAGDVLFRIDRERFELAQRQAEANVAGRRAALDLAPPMSAATGSSATPSSPSERLEQAPATQRQAQAAYDQALADRDLARLNLARSEVRASVTGTITNVAAARHLRGGRQRGDGAGRSRLVFTSTASSRKPSCRVSGSAMQCGCS